MFNSGMAMASLQVKEIDLRRGGQGAFTVQGQLYRRIGPMLATAGRQPSCLQVYFLDPEEQANVRAQRLANQNENDRQRDLDRNNEIFTTLGAILRQSNRYYQSFLSVNEFITTNHLNPTEVSVQIHDSIIRKTLK